MKLALASLLAGTAAAASSAIRADSKAGRNLLGRARRLDGGNDNMSWAAGYSLKFEQCVTTNDYYGGYFGGNQDNNNDNNNGNYNGVYEQRLVHFKLCPSDACGASNKCEGGAGYVIDLTEFVQAYVEYKAEADEAQCEYVAANCYCENANDDDACEAQCYMNAGIYNQCVEQDNQNNNGQDEEEFELEEALECAELEVDEDAMQYYQYNNNGGNQNYNNNNNNNNGQEEMQLFVGAYCSADGASILLGVFMDEMCSYAAAEGIYEGTHYGKALPYSSESIVSNACISCRQPADDDGNNNNNNQNYNYNNGNDDANNYQNYNNNNNNGEDAEILEFCERVYEEAGKCETNLNAYGVYPNTMACEFIESFHVGMRTRIATTFQSAKSKTPGVLVGLFAASTVALAGVAYHFHTKLQRQSVGMMETEGAMA